MLRSFVALLVLLTYSAAFAEQMTSTWLNAVSGNWTDASNWSTAAYPNNDAVATYTVVIDAAGNPYVVTLDGLVSLNSLKLDSPSAELRIEHNLTTSLLDIQSGNVRANGCTLTGTTIQGSSAGSLRFAGYDSKLDGVTLAMDADVELGTAVEITNGLTLDGASIHLGRLGTTQNSASLKFLDSGLQSLSGTGEVVFDYPIDAFDRSSSISAVSGSFLMIEPDITIRTGLSGGMVGGYSGGNYYYPYAGGIINAGTISACTPKQTIELRLNGGTNIGLIEARNGGKLDLFGEIPLAALGDFRSSDGGVITLWDGLDLGGGTLTLNEQTGDLTVRGATIHDGTITSSGGSTLRFTGTPTLGNVTLAADMELGADVAITNGLTLDGASVHLGHLGTTENVASLKFSDSGSQLLGGTGEVVFDYPLNNLRVNSVSAVSGSTLIIGPDVTIRTGLGGGIVGGYSNYAYAGGIINAGTISACTPKQTIELRLNGGLNAGLIEARNGGKLDLFGEIPLAALGDFRSSDGGVVTLREGLDLGGGTLTLNEQTGDLTVRGATIHDGTITSSGGSTLRFADALTLENVTLAADLETQGQGIIFAGNSELSGSVVHLSGGYRAYLSLATDATLGGTGEIVLNSSESTFMSAQPMYANGTATVGEGVTVRMIGGGANKIENDTMINEGMFLVGDDTSRSSLKIQCERFENHGLMEVNNTSNVMVSKSSNNPIEWANMGTLRIASGAKFLLDDWSITKTADLGTIENSGLFVLDGILDNTGDEFDPAILGNADINGTIRGGAIRAADEAVRFCGGTFDGVTVDANLQTEGINVIGDMEILNGRSITLKGGYMHTLLFTDPSATLGGDGEILMTSSRSYLTAPLDGVLTIAPGITVATDSSMVDSGTIWSTNTASGRLINRGVISASAGDGIKIYKLLSVENEGTFEARNGAKLEVAGLTGNLNNAVVSNGGWMDLTGNFVINQPLNVSADSRLSLRGEWSNTSTLTARGAVLDLDGIFSVDDLGSHDLTDATVNLVGTLENTDKTMMLGGSNGQWLLASGGKVVGGKISSVDGAVLRSSGTVATLDGVTLDADAEFGGNSMDVYNGLSVTGGRTIRMVYIPGNNTFPKINLRTGKTVLENCELIFDRDKSRLNIYADAEFEIGPDAVVRNGATSSAVISNSGPAANFRNYGTISAQNGESLSISNITNYGLLEARDGSGMTVTGLCGNLGQISMSGPSNMGLSGEFVINQPITILQDQTVTLGGVFTNDAGINVTNGTLTLAGSFTNEQVGTMLLDHATVQIATSYNSEVLDQLGEATSIFDITGTMDATDSTLAIPAMGTWRLAGGKITGGTVSTPGTVLHAKSKSSSRLENVTFTGSLSGADASLNLIGGVNAGNIEWTDGYLSLDGNWSNSGSLRTIGSDVMVKAVSGSFGDFVVDGGTLFMNSSTNPVTTAQLRSVERSGGAVLVLGGMIDNSNDVLLVSDSQPIELLGGTIAGGRIASIDGSPLRLTDYRLSYTNLQPGCTLQGVTLATDFFAENPVTLRSGLTFEESSTLSVSGAANYRSRLYVVGDQEIAGEGQLKLHGLASSYLANYYPLAYLQSSTLTVGPQVEVVFDGGFGQISRSGDSRLINNGVIAVQDNGQAMIALDAVYNHGLIKATGGSSLTLTCYDEPLINDGIIQIDATSHITISGNRLNSTAESLIWIELLSQDMVGSLNLYGELELAGGLKLSFADGFDLERGQIFDIITASGSILGEFDSLDTSLLPAGWSVSVHYGTQAVSVEIVPEPATAALLALGGLALLRRRRIS